MSQARLPRTEPSTELITAHKVNNCDAHAALQTRDFSALPKHRASFGLHFPAALLILSYPADRSVPRACGTGWPSAGPRRGQYASSALLRNEAVHTVFMGHVP